MRFLIAGCGIGGLSAAHAISQMGHEVVLLERANALKPVGAGISLQPNARQALKQLGLDREVAKVSFEAQSASVISNTGRVYIQFSFDHYIEKFGFLPTVVYRGDLIRVLADKLPSNVEVKLNTTFDSYESLNEKLLVHSKEGSTIECDAIVGADGIHSAVRKQLWGQPNLQYAVTLAGAAWFQIRRLFPKLTP